MPKRLNILFLMSDEHRFDVAGFAGNEVVRTPNLDRLAQTGVVFTNAYTPSPVCVPARQCLLAGQLPKTCGCEGAFPLAPGYMTFPRLFSQYAYQTVACGKLHARGQDNMMGFNRRIGCEANVDRAYIGGIKPEEFSKYERPFKDYKWDDAKEIKRAGIGKAPNVTEDRYTVDGAIKFINDYFVNPYYDREQANQPLLLKVSLVQPHYPYSASEEKFSYYLNRVKLYSNQQLSDHPFLKRRAVVPGVDASEREIRRCIAAYYAMVETVDDHFGEVLRALENAGQNLDEWIVVYTSDHGEMMGEHSVWEKQKFYEGSVKVPLFIRYPEAFAGGNTVDKNVNLCDLFATFCELCGIPAPDGLDSRSLVPLMRGNTDGWNNETVSHFSDGGHDAVKDNNYVNNLMIKQDNLKYQFYQNMPEVLFDLKRNPEETVNFIDDPAYASSVERIPCPFGTAWVWGKLKNS
jgi:choline-sulfatase